METDSKRFKVSEEIYKNYHDYSFQIILVISLGNLLNRLIDS